MATVKATITLTSSDLTSDALSLTHNQTMTLTQGGITRYAVTGTTSGAASTLYTAVGATTTLYTGNDQAGPVYMWIKNTDPTATDYAYVFVDNADDTVVLQLRGGEAGWLALNDAATYKCFVATAETVIEYGIFA